MLFIQFYCFISGVSSAFTIINNTKTLSSGVYEYLYRETICTKCNALDQRGPKKKSKPHQRSSLPTKVVRLIPLMFFVNIKRDFSLAKKFKNHVSCG